MQVFRVWRHKTNKKINIYRAFKQLAFLIELPPTPWGTVCTRLDQVRERRPRLLLYSLSWEVVRAGRKASSSHSPCSDSTSPPPPL